MNSKFDKILDLVESLPMDEREQLVIIENRRIIESKRKKLIKEIKEAKSDYKKGNYVSGNVKYLMQVIDNAS